MRVLALDPGDRVGWARADVHPDGSWTDLRHGITPLREMALAIHDAMNINYAEGSPEYDVVIYEEWRLYKDKANEFIGSTFPSVQFVGMVRMCGWLSSTKVVAQGARIKGPADKTMAIWRPELHRKVTKPGRHDDQHDLDALRHLWFYTFKEFINAPPEEAAA